ncbi:hypothetical protein P9314_18315 [Paenibacillus validus]|uniref:LiaF transmembrane domain-containing protein n=1 Tax=Paenibacillus validus TaxID=44253 RepID=A0A7X2ZDK9_9BACL|nr:MULTISPECIES: hypothetical protein [Paenibacillus]MED4602606.1 hypothetical protein [Paenibacillus validus]MED4607888.1 hypothetical protein [Paenibacillus validus]MUG72975.1 hypothetical protein [Paenibacillus validus]
MRMNKHTGLAVLLIFFGALILLNKTGFHIGHHVMSILFPAAMVGLGFVGLKNGKSIIGWILIGIGGLILLGKLSGLIGLLVAIGLIGYGVSMLRCKKSVY